MKIGLVDADGVAYTLATTNEDTDSYEEIRLKLHDIITDICRQIDTPQLILFIRGKDNFRTTLAKIRPYKGNRTPKPIKWLNVVYSILENEYKAIRADGAEADDYVASAKKIFQDKAIICSYDKDFRQIPGTLFDLSKQQLVNITPQEAAYYKYRQILMGDSSDNIQGIPGIGQKKADKILEDCSNEEELLCRTVLTYQTFIGPKWLDQFTENYKLIHLKDDIEFNTLTVVNIDEMEPMGRPQ